MKIEASLLAAANVFGHAVAGGRRRHSLSSHFLAAEMHVSGSLWQADVGSDVAVEVPGVESLPRFRHCARHDNVRAPEMREQAREHAAPVVMVLNQKQAQSAQLCSRAPLPLTGEVSRPRWRFARQRSAVVPKLVRDCSLQSCRHVVQPSSCKW